MWPPLLFRVSLPFAACVAHLAGELFAWVSRFCHFGCARHLGVSGVAARGSCLKTGVTGVTSIPWFKILNRFGT